MYHIVYLTKNKINGKIYVGKHSTSNIDDGYLGSSTVLKDAIAKYGIENFERTILRYCDSSEEAYKLEAHIVGQSPHG